MPKNTLLKRQANEIIKKARPSAIGAGGLYLLLIIVFSFLSSRLLGVGMTETDAAQYTKYVMEGNIDKAIAYFTEIAPPPGAYIIDTALSIVSWIVSAGFTLFIMNTVRSMNASYGNLLDGFGFAGRVILLNVLQSLFISLWTLLFIIPGIIAAYSYRMAFYIMIDHPEMSVFECLRESKRMMRGHKWELLGLDISFVGWYILAMIPYVSYVVQLWTLPYINTTLVLFYESIRGRDAGSGYADYVDYGSNSPWEN